MAPAPGQADSPASAADSPMLQQSRDPDCAYRANRKDRSPCEYESGETPEEAGLAETDAAAEGTEGAGQAESAEGAAAPAAAPSAYASYNVRGGYVAAGTGLRNRGFGTIGISGIPIGASVYRAFLYWSILGTTEGANFNDGRVNGTAIVGALIGSGGDPGWSVATRGYAYRADVTTLVKAKGNGAYSLTNFASGKTDGSDPFSGATPVLPLAEGASLVVIYTKSTYPVTRIQIYNGYSRVSSSETQTLTASWGFAASNPVGEVRTTFIGGDGQKNASEPLSLFNGVGLSNADWDGTDPPFPAYSQGNLWDTDTSSVGRFVKPGNTSATITVRGGPDILIWVAQVLSVAFYGQVDTDGDSLLDGWEANGYDFGNNGTIDFNLPFYGASVVRKDIFVEMDYMGAEAACPCHLPLTADLNRIYSVFATSPYANNPNGQTGIYIHLDAGSARGSFYNLGGGNLVPHDNDLNPRDSQFNALKSAHFNPARAKIFHYMIWAHGYDGGSSSGYSFGIPADSFIVTLGLWGGHGSSDEKVGTFIHELGHNLGLGHGGNEGKNRKSNYLSVMSYNFQTGGVLRTGTTPPYFGYSYYDLPDLNEASLNESVGLNSGLAATYRTRWYCPSGTLTTSPGTANGPLDWNCNGAISSPVSRDLNGDGVLNTLTSWRDWGNLVYNGGAVGAGERRRSNATAEELEELTYEEHLQHQP
jgi:hypothetical protein